MLIQRIHAENYKTYLSLDLDISVRNERPIILDRRNERRRQDNAV